ncbi:flagellar motor switch protein FliM [Mangrovimicrobium sediminis]|uniref:Flagellar motor switch protein FliM n=1 Tax=Mangrovimicrobium sediminis TaxID=2562682 RepID=A0A4Z0M126_9GAMM|nr:flagellar motor switch protein FliM [Haliea sp. SAOS-164]TGD73146.1 flagellar motor switch protein FliM [Haliea sp. SAOS-164]
MSEDDFLVQDEIDALLNSVSGDDDSEADAGPKGARPRPYDPRTQHRIIKERLHGLDMINQRFARLFRIALFNLIRRNADITVDPIVYESYSKYSRNVPVPTNINLVSIKPLRGTALIVFPPAMVFMVVDNLFGGDGRFLARSEGREFTATEQRIIQRLLSLAIGAYEEAWESIYPIKVEYLRSEMQAKFANITNSPNEVIVNTKFHLDVGNASMGFQICIPYSMIEPLRETLSNPRDRSQPDGEVPWSDRVSWELRETEVEVVADFVDVTTRISDVLSLKIGDILPIDLPDSIEANIDGVPVLECGYGSRNGHRALSVREVFDTGQANYTNNPLPEQARG